VSNYFLHETSIVGEEVLIGQGTKIWQFCHVMNGAEVGENCNIGQNNVINPRSFIERKDEYKDTLVSRGASIGANATILCGCRIGRYAMVGAGAVVTHDVGDYQLVYGNPARVEGWVCRCGTRLILEHNISVCRHCGLLFFRTTDGQVRCDNDEFQ